MYAPATALLLTCAVAHGSEVDVQQWSVHEIRLTAQHSYDNPYLQAAVSAEFSGPSSATLTVSGFWDGDETFVIRFTPTAAGDWHYRTVSDDPGLGGQSGMLRAVAPTDARGFLRRDETHRHHFVWDDGSRAFIFGTTYYDLLSNLVGGGTWQQAIDGVVAYGINKVRFKTSRVRGDSRGSEYPQSSPYSETKDELNLEHFRALDEAVLYLQDRGVVADPILFWNSEGDYGTAIQDERYVHYLLARYASYPHVVFTLSNEWEYTDKPPEYWNSLGRLVVAEDPWLEVAGRRRALSIHQRTRLGWQFGDQDWPTHVIVQYGVRNPGGEGVSPEGTPRYAHGDQWGYESIRFNLGHNLPVINDEYGYAGEPNDESILQIDGGGDDAPPMTRDKHRHIMWGIYLAGGYGSTGDKYWYESPPGRPYFGGNWHDIEEYGDVKHLVDFFTAEGVRYWNMQPDHAQSSVEQRVYVLHELGQSYVIYVADGGEASVALDGGPYRAVRYDPRTGERTDLGDVSGNAALSTPSGQDWVIWLETQPAQSRLDADEG